MIIFCVIAVGECNHQKEGRTIAFLVNSQRIEDCDIEAEFERLRPDYERLFTDQSARRQREQLLEWSKENLIESTLLRQYAKEKGPAVSESSVRRAVEKAMLHYEKQGEKLNASEQEKLGREIELQIKIEMLMQDICKDIPEPTKEQIEQYYEQNKQQFRTPEQVRASHIVKHINWQCDQEQAGRIITKAYDELKQGASFEELVAGYSDCTDNAGDLGFMTPGQMVEEFEDVVFNLGAGQVSDVFRTRFGFHIAKVHEIKASVTKTLEQVRDEVIKAVTERMRSEAIGEFLDGLRKEAHIEEV